MNTKECKGCKEQKELKHFQKIAQYYLKLCRSCNKEQKKHKIPKAIYLTENFGIFI